MPLIISGIKEVKVHGAWTIVMGKEDGHPRAKGDDLGIIAKSDAQIDALLGVLPIQLLSRHISLIRGFGPDFPRTVTVD